MDNRKTPSKSVWLFLAVMIAGIAARMLVATRGHNYDMDSWQIVAGIMAHGGNVYAGTERYNYGPVWFNVLYVLDLLAGRNPVVLRYLISGLLSLVDAGIFFILWRRFGKLAGSFFFLNPISIIITGYHTQIDNLALLLGLAAALLLGDEFDRPVNRRRFFGLVVLGVSLAAKHILFAFPFWLAIKQRGMLQKLTVLLVPVLVFVLSFLPYWPAGSQGIIQHVFLYRSFGNGYFYHLFVPMSVQFMFSSQMIWFFLLAVFAFVFKPKNTLESLLLYTCVLVAASPAVVNQYLAIPMPFVATHLNLLTLLFTAVGTWHLLVDVNGLHLASVPGTSVIDIAVCLLCLELIWVAWRQPILAWSRQLLEWCVTEAKNQLGLKK